MVAGEEPITMVGGYWNSKLRLPVLEAIMATETGPAAASPGVWPPVATGAEEGGSDDADVTPTTGAH